MAFSQQITDGVNLVVNELMADEGLNCEIVIRKRGVTAWDSELQRNVTTETELTVTAVRLRHRRRSVERSGSPNIQIGDQVFLVKYGDVTGGITVNDQIEFEGQSLVIKQVDNVFGMVYSITTTGS